MIPRKILQAACLLASTASAQSIAEQLSFGFRTPLAPQGQGIPGWGISSSNANPQILSDRIILTPPVPGNARGALWTEHPLNTESWTAELEFRASGPYDGGSGNIQLWLVKDKNAVSTSSVYTVNSFDGMALVMDQYGGRGGGLRGFLNDGTQNFQAHSSLASLAFGHCDYSYRNRGFNSKITVRSNRGLSVSIDDKECFTTDRITLPTGYYFGVTAATAENPDSFEVHKFIVKTGGTQPQNNAQKPSTIEKLDRFPGAPEALPDTKAEDYRTSEAQFQDLHNRLQGLAHQLGNMFNEMQILSQRMETQKHEILNAVPASQGQGGGASVADMQQIKQQLKGIEVTVARIQQDVENRDYREHFDSLGRSIEHVRGTIHGELGESLGNMISASSPRLGAFIFVVIAVQIMMAGVYIVYKRRRANAPKKYL